MLDASSDSRRYKPASMPLVDGGHSAGVSLVPVAPPMRAWQSHRPADPGVAAWIFHSTRIRPAVAPRVVKMRSCISTSPIAPDAPTLIKTWGLGAKASGQFERKSIGIYSPYSVLYRAREERGHRTCLASSKYDPDATNCDHVSPTILAPGGIVRVEVKI